MAERQGATARTLQQNGEYGNKCIAILADVLADADGDVVVLGSLPGGSKITRVSADVADLGTGTTMDLGFRYKTSTDGTSDPDAFGAAVDVATAASKTIYGDAAGEVSVDIAQGDGVEIIFTVGGAAAAGAVEVIVDYVYNGNG